MIDWIIRNEALFEDVFSRLRPLEKEDVFLAERFAVRM